MGAGECSHSTPQQQTGVAHEQGAGPDPGPATHPPASVRSLPESHQQGATATDTCRQVREGSHRWLTGGKKPASPTCPGLLERAHSWEHQV